jgi:hypothetical protein
MDKFLYREEIDGFCQSDWMIWKWWEDTANGTQGYSRPAKRRSTPVSRKYRMLFLTEFRYDLFIAGTLEKAQRTRPDDGLPTPPNCPSSTSERSGGLRFVRGHQIVIVQ